MTQERGIESWTAGEDSFSVLLRDTTLCVARDVNGENLQEALQRIRAHFCYGSAFIYELEPAKGLVLQKHVTMFKRNELPESFFPEQIFTQEQREVVALNPLQCASCATSDDGLLGKLATLFKTQSFFIIFILDEKNALMGCIGMADSRIHTPLTATAMTLIEAALLPVVEKARFRVCRRRLDYTSGTLESIMDHIGFDIYVNDFDTHELLYANRSMAAPYGGWRAMAGKECFRALYDDQEEECAYCPKKHLIDDEGNPSKIYSWDYQRPFDGRWFRVISAAFQWTDGRLAHVISSTDINDAKENELLIERMAYYDLLTNIPNRRKLENDLNDLIKINRQAQAPIAVMFLDLNGFKGVNDHYGHSGGDALLRHVSRLFSEHPLTSKCCYRYGGDEFIFLLNCATSEGIENMKTALGEMLETPFQLEGDMLTCSGSIGVACFPRDGATYWELLDNADDAMYEKKQLRGPSRGSSR